MRAFASLPSGSASLRSAEFDRQLRLEWLCALALAGGDAFRIRQSESDLRCRMMADSVIGMIRPVVRNWQAGAAYSLVDAIGGTADAIAALLDHSNACYENLAVANYDKVRP